MINIIVCIKQVLDPEAPTSAFSIDPVARRAIPAPGIPPVLNPYDENALEAALRIKDRQSAKITVLSMAPHFARPVMRKTLALGADELVLLEDKLFDNFDSYFTAFVLAKAIRKVGKYDIILCGREAADSDSGQVGIGIAEILRLPGITLARKLETINGKVRVERLRSDGYEVVEAPMPVLVTATSEIGELRTTSVTELILAQQKAITVWDSQVLGNPWPEKRTSILKLFTPSREVNYQLITGDTPQQAGENLARQLRAAKLI